MKEDVILNIYDISNGMVANLSPVIFGRRIEAIYHTGVLVYEYEYFYGSAIISVKPEEIKRMYGITPIKSLNLGQTNINKQDFDEYLRSISTEFNQDHYDLITHNCNHFSEKATKYLLGTGIPSYILDLPNDIMSTPFGSMIIPWLQNIQKNELNQSTTNNWDPNKGEILNINNQNQHLVENYSLDIGKSAELVATLERVRIKYKDEMLRLTQTLRSIISNILNNSNEMKYRSIKSDSSVFTNSIAYFDSGIDILLLLGFKRVVTESGVEKYEIQLFENINEEESKILTNYLNIINKFNSQTQTGTSQRNESSQIQSNISTSYQNDSTNIDYVEFLNKIEEMGFTDKQKIIKALHKTKGNISETLDLLI